MMVNLDLFKQAGVEPPKTWEDFYAAAKKISALPDVHGFGLQGKEVETDADPDDALVVEWRRHP